MEEGKIIREGRISDNKLKDQFLEYINVDDIAKRRSAGLEEQKRQIQTEIERIDIETQAARSCLEKFDALDQAKQQADVVEEDIGRISRERKASEDAFSKTGAFMKSLNAELAIRRGAVFKFFRRSEKVILADIQRCTIDREQIETRIVELNASYQTARERFREVQRVYEDRRAEVVGKDRVRAQEIVKKSEARRACVDRRIECD